MRLAPVRSAQPKDHQAKAHSTATLVLPRIKMLGVMQMMPFRSTVQTHSTHNPDTSEHKAVQESHVIAATTLLGATLPTQQLTRGAYKHPSDPLTVS